jgi:hypothetical protein
VQGRLERRERRAGRIRCRGGITAPEVDRRQRRVGLSTPRSVAREDLQQLLDLAGRALDELDERLVGPVVAEHSGGDEGEAGERLAAG